MKKIVLLLLLITAKISLATTYYVATNGNDNNLGTAVNIPFLTITKAVSKVVAGDIIYLRGGNYNITTKISISKSGTVTNRITMMGYPGDSRPVINGSNMATSTSNRGIELSGSYWTIKGLDVYKAGDNGMHISGAYNIIDQCNFYENRDTGCQLANGANNNQIINCDSYYNRDSTSSTNYDGNADGFAAKLDVGTGNSFKGCRAWQNSDDGWDGLLSTGLGTNPSTTYDSCWCFMNGYYKSGLASTGNGNGFKMGGNNERHDATLTRCLSAYNKVKGFDQNNNNGSMILYNCTGYKNKPNFGMNNNNPDAGEVMIVKNCVSLSSGSSDVFRSVCTRTNNSWQTGVTTTTADFVSIDSAGLRNPRKPDGSLPDINFMHLVQGSDLIDAGVNIGLSFNGTNPDLGCFETNYPLPLTMISYQVLMKNNNQVLNNWKTTNEINVSHYNIERSNNAQNFTTIGKVKANNKQENDYSFTDDLKTNEQQLQTLYYRISGIDFDGRETYSAIKTISKRQLFNTVNIFPNPTKSLVNIECKESISKLLIIDYSGRVIKQLNNPAEQYQTINTQQFAKGIYVVQVTTMNNKVFNEKLIIE